ncbi:histidine kinase [[Clostridium] scindens]|uniref:histidine kinase n=1 Tax=Clostridium scindens (strain JCM 10418 / VPI 12708) TaxID=29347 RepID=UPI001D08D412|nr:histidine kinase [[Clostridium] scindens]MCB6645591.1 histidine kinase [[Clostridium] scindens]
MDKRKYSSKKIMKIILAGVLIYLLLVIVSAILMTGMIESRYLRLFVILAEIALGAGYYTVFYRSIYKPNLRLEQIIRDLNHEQIKEDDDMLREIKSIISSLDSMAIKQKNAEILMKNAEINNLQDQINPHFLYNTLEVIRGEALLNGDRKIADMTASLANYFRYNISRRETFVFLKDELKKLSKFIFISQKEENACVNKYKDALRIKTPSVNQLVGNLSGGNQQKVAVAKWLASESKILILDEPTRGIDVGAKQEIYELINQLTQEGLGIIMISSEMEEIMGMSDRMLVMAEGNVVGELQKEEFSQDKILRYASNITT